MQLPDRFDRQMRKLLSPEEYPAFCQSLDMPACVAVRPNKDKGVKPVEGLQRVAWSSKGYMLDERKSFTFDPLWHAGAYYVQEPSSMFVEQALKQCVEPLRVLDLCASPGGKSTLLRSLLPADSLLVCNEPLAARARILVENMQKWGHPRVVVTSNLPAAFRQLEGYFDVILADVPCSGEGMFRKAVPALEEWREENVSMCRDRGRQILQDVWPSLKQGGCLIYSTCTYNTLENEDNVNYVRQQLGAVPVEIPVSPSWNIRGNLLGDPSCPVYHFMPHQTQGEGFFLACLRKKSPAGKPHVKSKSTLQALPRECRSWLKDSDDMMGFFKGDELFAVPRSCADDVVRLDSTLHVLHAGVPLSVTKGRKRVPHPSLPLSTQFHPSAFPVVEVGREQALDYLRRLSLHLPVTTPKGYVVLAYRGLPLGFVNNLGLHANNLYPPHWKIRSSHTPSDDCQFLQTSSVLPKTVS